jgi:hypothetical protein
MDFRKLLWLFPIAVTLHNAEEAIWMPGWDAGHLAHLRVRPPGAAEILTALVMFTVAAFTVTYMSAVVVPHVPAAIVFHGYAPGVVTAVLINLPVMSILVIRMLREGWVHGWKMAAFGVGVPLVMGGAIVTWVAGHT